MIISTLNIVMFLINVFNKSVINETIAFKYNALVFRFLKQSSFSKQNFLVYGTGFSQLFNSQSYLHNNFYSSS